MGMLLKGCNTNRSLSPVTMQSAFADMARESHLSSLGSRHSEISSVILTGNEWVIIFSINSIRVGTDIYLSNFVLKNTRRYSAFTDSEISKTSWSLAFLKPSREQLFHQIKRSAMYWYQI